MVQDLLISVITPSFNQGRFIKATLDSVLKQDYTHIEHIIMDGGSTDETVDILKNYADPRLQWISEPDKGQSDAINKGLRMAKGDILAYLNSDDLYLEGTLAFVADYFYTYPEIDLIYGNCSAIDSAGQSLPTSLTAEPFHLRNFFVKRPYIPQPSTFWRRSVIEQIGLFDESLHYAMDRDYWLRAAAAGFKFQYINKNLAAFRFHEDSKTVSQGGKFWSNVRTIIDKVYAMPDLPTEISALKPLAIAYADYDGAELTWRDDPTQARELLKGVISSAAPLPLRTLAAARYIDTYLHTPFADWLKILNERRKNL